MSPFDQTIVQQADRTIAAAIRDVRRAPARSAVVCSAPAGAGKSYAIGTVLRALRADRARVAIAAPTNEQAASLVRDTASRFPDMELVWLHAQSKTPPEDLRGPKLTLTSDSKAADHATVLVGTLDKLGDAFTRGDLARRDVLLVDEAYQATSVHTYMVGDLAPRHFLVGDAGQLAPFTTAPGGDRWRGLGVDPLLTSVELTLRNHPATPVHKLPVSRRLDRRAVPVARAFYPTHPFDAAVLPGVRRMDLARARAGRGAGAVDGVLEHAAREGWAHVELPRSAVVAADPEAADTLVRLVRRFFDRAPSTTCERGTGPLQAREVAVAVSHNDQKAAVAAGLAACGLGDVVVSTANKLQGLTFEVVFAWHPLAGLVDADPFHLDPGRLCVMLTRHRHACIVVGREGDRELVEGLPPTAPSYVGWDREPALEGWFAHERVFDALGPHRFGLAS